MIDIRKIKEDVKTVTRIADRADKNNEYLAMVGVGMLWRIATELNQCVEIMTSNANENDMIKLIRIISIPAAVSDVEHHHEGEKTLKINLIDGTRYELRVKKLT